MKHISCPTFRAADSNTDTKLGIHPWQGNKRCKRFTWIFDLTKPSDADAQKKCRVRISPNIADWENPCDKI